jgi:hypothetical protein
MHLLESSETRHLLQGLIEGHLSLSNALLHRVALLASEVTLSYQRFTLQSHLPLLRVHGGFKLGILRAERQQICIC